MSKVVKKMEKKKVWGENYVFLMIVKALLFAHEQIEFAWLAGV